MTSPDYSPNVTAFRALHQSGCFVLPNPWDIGSAKMLQHLGFKALATTSAGFAFSRGLPDSMAALSLADVLAHIREIVAATPLPVNADFQAGYATDLDGVAKNVTSCVQTGVAGLSIEDASGNPQNPLFDRAVAIERVRATRKAIDATGTGVVLTARCEVYLFGNPDARQIALDRLTAFAEAGADCLYAPGVRDIKVIEEIVKAVAPKPVNVIASTAHPDLTVAKLADVGVRRISVGSALARVAWSAFIRAAESIASTGTFEAFADITPIKTLNEIFDRNSRNQ